MFTDLPPVPAEQGPDPEDYDLELEEGDGFWEEDRPATESEAHLEWHRNTGVPLGQPGCPQDACHSDEVEGYGGYLMDGGQ